MNEIKVNVSFKNRTLIATGVDVTTGDYNSTKIKFNYDRSDGRKIFEMNNPDGELVYLGEIVNDEIVLVGEADDTTTHEDVEYIKYKDSSDNVYWYDPDSNSLFDSEWLEVVDFDLDNYTKQTHKASIFSMAGVYPYEISLYDGDSKITSATGKLKAKQEQIEIDGNIVTSYLPIFDELINDLTAATDASNNLNIEASKTGDTAIFTITKKDGSTFSISLYDGVSLDFNWDGTKLGIKRSDQGNYQYVDLKGPQGDDYVITQADYTAIANIVKNAIVIPTKTSDLTNDSGFITNTINNLTNYYLKSQTYTKDEVNGLIGQISTLQLVKVEELPTTGSSGIIYLVPTEDPETQNVFEEYIWVDNDWELIGSTKIDLTGYATETWVTGQISDFMTSSEITNAINTALANYYTKTQVDTLLSNKADSSVLGDYVRFTDYATPSVAGVVKVGSNYGVGITSNDNSLYIRKATNADIDAETDLYKPLVSGNYRRAVNNVIEDRFITLTQAQYDALETKDADTYYYIVEE